MKIKKTTNNQWAVLPDKKMQLQDIKTGELLNEYISETEIFLEDAMFWFREVRKRK